MLESFSDVSKLFGLAMRLGIKLRCFIRPHQAQTPPSRTIVIDDTQLALIERFKYLGSTISFDKETDSQISKSSQALRRLRLTAKLRVYNTVVLSSVLDGYESWTLYRRHIKKLENFHMWAPLSIIRIRWQDHVTNLEVLDHAPSSII